MFKRPTKKQQLMERIGVSIVAVLTVLVIVTITIMFTLGYRLDGDSGKFEQGALLQFDSKPNGADVWVDGSHAGSKTASKKMVMAGERSIIFSRNGYEDWVRTVDLKSGTLTWLDYARLVPKNRPVESVASFDSAVAGLASVDGKTYLVQEDLRVADFVIIDLRSEKVKSSTISLPANLISDGQFDLTEDTLAPVEYRAVKWDNGGRYVLVSATQGDAKEWLVLDVQDVLASRNISRSLSVDISEADFVGNDGRTLYALLADKTIRKLDLGNLTISRALVSRVDSFAIDYESKIISYVGVDPADEARKVAGVYRDGDASGHVLRGTITGAPLRIDATAYHGSIFYAISEGGSVTILRGDYPRSESDLSKLANRDTISLDTSVSNLSFSPTGRFLVAQADSSYASYEVEHRRIKTLALDEAETTMKWLDEAYLWNNIGDKLKIRDFDGSNSHEIMKSTAGFDSTLSQNGRFMYTLNKQENGLALQRVKMILD